MLAAMTLGGCGGGRMSLDPTEWFGSSGDSRATTGAEGGFTVTRGNVEIETTRPVSPSDLVGADGQCQGGATAGRPLMLSMTECELVATAGVPEQVNLGGETGERRVVLTYSKGDYPGIYTFVGGRLKIIERVAPPKPEPRRRAPKKQQRT
jgi:hypothetical protein